MIEPIPLSKRFYFEERRGADFLKNNLSEKGLFPQKLTKRAIIP
jgi:hypothetical protein